MPNLLAVSTLLTYADITPTQSERQARDSTASGEGKYYWRYPAPHLPKCILGFLDDAVSAVFQKYSQPVTKAQEASIEAGMQAI